MFERRARAFGLLFTATLSGCAGATPPPPITIAVAVDTAGQCVVAVDGERLTDEHLLARLRARHRKQEVQLTGLDLNLPYRCIGGVIYTLQRARVSMKMGFVAEPPAGDDAPPQRER